MKSLLPLSTILTRPRTVCEIRVEGVLAARANDSAGLLAQAAQVSLAEGAIAPSLHAGNVVDRVAVVAALRKALGEVKSTARNAGRDVTLIVPDSSVRVLLLDFDTLPPKAEEALPVIRFRLAKMLPFDAERASVSYQAMGTHDRVLQVLVVAMPCDVLSEYESVVREAGFEPGAVMPSTLAVLAALHDADNEASLLVNVSEQTATTAIVRKGELLLYRTLDMRASTVPEVAATEADPALLTAEVEVSFAEPAETALALELADEERVEQDLFQSISVATAYFEDLLGIVPEEILIAGSDLKGLLQTVTGELALRTREVIDASDVLAETASAGIPRGLQAGLRGALKS